MLPGTTLLLYFNQFCLHWAQLGSPEIVRMEELICDINDVSALSDFEDITFYLSELQNITFIEKCFRIFVVFGGIPLKYIVVLLLIYSHQFHDPWVGHPIFRSAISFLKCALLFQCVLEQVIVINRDHLVCRILILIAPTSTFSYCLSQLWSPFTVT